jgi:hypothetical protein
MTQHQAADWDGSVNMDGVANKHNKGTKVLIENAQHDVRALYSLRFLLTRESN